MLQMILIKKPELSIILVIEIEKKGHKLRLHHKNVKSVPRDLCTDSEGHE
jgi:hypothetical protein